MREAISAQAISNALYGLQGMSSEVTEVRALLYALTAQMIASSDVLTSQAVSNALYGLQGFNSDSPEVRALLQVLTVKVLHCTASYWIAQYCTASHCTCFPI
jgi:hypothetical protein